MPLTWGFWSCGVSSARHPLCWLVLIMAACSFALGGRGQNRVQARTRVSGCESCGRYGS